ncbi:hypothetical protein [uncultured Polaribacter sp.]|uniref:hypothetical protein n=1 Tax=uncultured Polaribacter sp. TaxID=174711 RepID=UPI00259BB749|nr:hypothetical protein [uncultured Polaribacter sp.]
MTKIELENIIKKGELPKDELDEFWSNFTYFFLLITFVIMTTYGIYKSSSIGKLESSQIMLFLFGIFILVFTFFSKKNEKRLKKVKTMRGIEQNTKIIEKLNSKEFIELTYNSENYYSGSLKTTFGKTHKIVFICVKNEILYNLRNVGSHKGRMPYNFGIDTINEFKIKRKIKNYVQQHI